ncbi:hypothetical protein SK128_028031 [Halocaridina rubra]|uniref:O-acyltransferase WSD1 C-terminal domain-containing protein n=1 Tax=Halocaridina rubra TaxID=373956 RepID=A0AAN8WWI5_HALRR
MARIGIKCWRICVGWWAVTFIEGVQELTGVTARTTLEEPDSPGMETLLFCLSGTPHITYLKEKIQKDILDRRGSDGKILHPNFRRRVLKICGYYAWGRHESFDISQHVTTAPMHHRGRIITTRNIQEYVSEVISSPLPDDLPPWRVVMITITDGGSEGEGETWIVARAHHLLATQLNFPASLVSAYPDPWQNPATRGLKLLSAPAATSKLTESLISMGKAKLETGKQLLNHWWIVRRDSVLHPLHVAVEETLKMAHKATPRKEFHTHIARQVGIWINFVGMFWRKVNRKANSLITMLYTSLYTETLYHGFLSLCHFTSCTLWWMIVWFVKLPVFTWKSTKQLYCWYAKRNENENYVILKDAMVEIYWMTRAIVTLPRLVLEEMLSIRGVTPLMGWVGRRQRTLSSRGLGRTGSNAVAWSDAVPLSTAKGVRGATGATISEILLTACAGAVRDYLRVTGLPVPDEVCCTVPVYSQRWAENRESAKTPGLVTLALPTGATDASSTLYTVRKSMEKIRRYPERYLASVWLMRNVAYFLPESLLGSTFRALSVRYPVVMSNLAGPSKPTSVWGHELLNVFYWRPPQCGAVLSICVTSYENRAHLGVMVDGRTVPNAAAIPQAFVTHLNELAVEAGVKLVRQCSRSWSRGSSPGSSPSSTPPPTPTSPHKTTFPYWNKPKISKSTRRQSFAF